MAPSDFQTFLWHWIKDSGRNIVLKYLFTYLDFMSDMTLEKMNNNSWAKKLLTLSVQNITSILELPYLYAYSTNSSKKEQRIRQRRSTFLGKMTGSAAGRECFIIAILFPEIYQFICQKGIELQCMVIRERDMFKNVCPF